MQLFYYFPPLEKGSMQDQESRQKQKIHTHFAL
nr:MAG TPA: hypothetical protein [Caudoviricetes sp.]